MCIRDRVNGDSKSPKLPLLLGARGPHLLHPSFRRLHSLHQTTTRSVYVLPHNYAINSALVTLGHPKFTLKLPLPFVNHHPHLIHHRSTDPTHHPKRHPDPISRFATVHFWTDGPTGTQTQTDRWSRRQVSKISAYARYTDRERCANNVYIARLVRYPIYV